ncbi:MAG: radical SAM protein [Chloroflexi bacterium]|nr:radical SAM protein [Chloroflexota bacterium]
MPKQLRVTPATFAPTPLGFYTYHTPEEDPLQYRLHLRVLPDETGILIVNATSVLRLNPTGTYIAWLKMRGMSEQEIVEHSLQRYQIEEAALEHDLRNFNQEIIHIVNNPDQAPNLAETGFDSLSTETPSDVALRVNLCLTDRWEEQAGSDEELSTEQWMAIIRKLFDAGIPQVVFIGGEPTLRSDLVDLLSYTEQLGMVSGLLSASPRLYQDPDYLDTLLDSGLDHLILEFDPESKQDLDLLKPIFDQDLFTCIRFPVHYHSESFAWTKELVAAGANAFSFYAAELDAHDQAAHLNHQLTNQGIHIEHDLPFPVYPGLSQQAKLFSPEVSVQEPAYYTVMPDGSLTPQDFPEHSLGSLINTDWHELIVKL